MAKDDIGGVWRTIGGRRVFIKDGQDLASAMKESGKFKKKKKEELTEEEKGKKMNETMDKRQKIIERLDKDTQDLSDYDKYNLAVSKLEQSENMQPTERQYWASVRDKYVQNEKTRETEFDKADKEFNEHRKKMEKAYDEFGGNTVEDEKKLNELSAKRDAAWRDKIINKELDESIKNKMKDYWDKEDKTNYRDKITDVAKNSKEDNVTLDVETGKPVSFEKGYSVSFQQSSDTYNDEEYAEKVAECRDKCDGKVYAGKYGGDAEASFHTDNIDDAKELMYKYNQESIYDWQHETLIMNDKYDASKNQTNYKSDELASNSGQEKIGKNVKVMRYGDDYIVLKNGHNEKEFKSQSDAENYAKTLTNNEYMNEKIRSGASKNKVKEDLPKRTEIKAQGTSNRKEVSENIQAHILDYYDSPQDFVEQMDAMDYLPTKWRAGEELAKGGSYMVYYDEQREFLDSLKINPSGKKFSDDKVFQTYTSLVGRESAKLYDRLKKNAYKKYLKEHPGSDMSFSDFKDMSKGGK